MTTGYDIVGDIHGHYDHLEAMLRKLGYEQREGAWRHPAQHMIFVGDLIDRGPKQVEVLDTIRRMVEAGSARCILGNHEFNAVCWATPDPDRPGAFLRPHGKPGNRKQHQEFLRQVGEGSSLHAEIVAWFRTLPLWLDLGDIRVVHACWHAPSMRVLASSLRADKSLPDELYVEASRKGSAAYEAVETLCKGIEVPLPDGITFHDKDGKRRDTARIRWWADDLSTYRKAAIGPPDVTDAIPDIPFPEALRPRPYEGPLVFFGHYWLFGEPVVLADNLACLDYSVATNGPLVAYRWEGEKDLSNTKLSVVG
jgi:diadenosine tetraphosphatase ApaH/serine/threonine PP2A family protein phosphatase